MALEAELARLRAENARLLRLLKLTLQQAAPPGPAQAAYFEAPPIPVDDGSPPAAKVAFYATLFTARTDVYATRFDNPHTGKGAGSRRRLRADSVPRQNTPIPDYRICYSHRGGRVGRLPDQ